MYGWKITVESSLLLTNYITSSFTPLLPCEETNRKSLPFAIK